jgi:hypothetical protein
VVDALNRSDAMTLLRHCLDVEGGGVKPGRHFRDELKAEGLLLSDAFHVLETGCIYDPPEFDVRWREWKYRVEGREPGGVYLAIILTFRSEDLAFLITVFSIERLSK